MVNLFNYPEGGTARKLTSLNQTECGDNKNWGSSELIAVYLCSRLWRHRSEATTRFKKSRFDHFTASQSLFISFLARRETLRFMSINCGTDSSAPEALIIHKRMGNAAQTFDMNDAGNLREIFFSVLPKSFRGKPPPFVPCVHAS